VGGPGSAKEKPRVRFCVSKKNMTGGSCPLCAGTKETSRQPEQKKEIDNCRLDRKLGGKKGKVEVAATRPKREGVVVGVCG